MNKYVYSLTKLTKVSENILKEIEAFYFLPVCVKNNGFAEIQFQLHDTEQINRFIEYIYIYIYIYIEG